MIVSRDTLTLSPELDSNAMNQWPFDQLRNLEANGVSGSWEVLMEALENPLELDGLNIRIDYKDAFGTKYRTTYTNGRHNTHPIP